MTKAAEAADVEIATGDTKVVERGHADGMYICTAGIGKVDPRGRLSPAEYGRATASSSREPSATTARRSCSRATSSRSTPRSSPTPGPSGRRSMRCSTQLEPSSTACATRRGAGSPRSSMSSAGRREWRSACGGQCPGQCGRRGRRGDARDRPDVRRQRGKACGLRRARSGGAGARGPALVSGCEQAAEIGEVKSEPPRAWCSSRPHSEVSGSWTSWSVTRFPGSADGGQPLGGKMANAVEIRTGPGQDGGG